MTTVTTPASDIYERVSRLEKLVDHLYGKGPRYPAPTIPLNADECLMCGGVHGNMLCPLLYPMSAS